MHTKSPGGRTQVTTNMINTSRKNLHKQITRQIRVAGVHETTIWNVTNMGPVKPGLLVRAMTLILKSFT